MNTKRSLVAFCLLLCLAVGCATVKPGADPVLVRAQQTYATAVNSCDLLFNLELDNRALIESKLPGTHAAVDKIKVNAKKYLPELLKATDSYSVAKTAENANALTIALAVIEDILRDVQSALVKTAGVGIVASKKG